MALPRLSSHVQPLFEHRLEFAGFDTRVLELEGDGPGLLLLHGWGDSADTWRPLLAELGARDRRRDPLLRRLLTLPLPIAPPVLRTTVGEIYRQLVFARPRAAEAAVVGASAAHHASRARVAAVLESGRRLLPDTRVELLDDVGHCPQLEATHQLLELLLPFPAGVRA